MGREHGRWYGGDKRDGRETEKDTGMDRTQVMHDRRELTDCKKDKNRREQVEESWHWEGQCKVGEEEVQKRTQGKSEGKGS